MHAQVEPTGGEALVGVFGVLLIAGLYLLPTVVAAVRKVPNGGSVFVINLLLGWTLIGWVVALAMAARSAPPPPVHQTFTTQSPVSPSTPATNTTSTPQGQGAAYCPQCGTKTTSGSHFCSSCGASLSGEAGA